MTMPDNGTCSDEAKILDSSALRPGLKMIRRRRWYLWAIILLYIPLMSVAMKSLPSFKWVMYVFLFWFIIMFTIALFAAVARCPRCGNYFHLHGMTLLYLRKCLHCQLHLKADKRS